ncbi:MAG: FAD-binding oxidoreductase [Chloroflexi bacterium]|nr:FAD-binding oxidoreductase [Chloroflexota bacterium]
MAESTGIAIIGGGAAGCAVAYYLARAGVRATIIEREGIGVHASGNSAGGLNPLQGAGIPGPLGPLAIESFRMHREMWDALLDESGVDFLPQMVYKVAVAYEESELPAMEETIRIYQAAEGFAAHWLDAGRVYEIEPRIAPGAIRALYLYGDAALSSHLFTVALSRAAERMGASVRRGNVVGLKASGGRVTGVEMEEGTLGCEGVVIASGPWSGEAEKWLGVPIPIEPYKGEIVRVELPGPPLRYEFSGRGVSLFARRDGLIWVGATEESKGFDLAPSEAAKQKLLGNAARLLPEVARARIVKHTACLRPLSKDWLPIIGAAPGWDNVYLATGAGKKGILIAPGIGKAVAELATRGATDLPIADFSPGRFMEKRA